MYIPNLLSMKSFHVVLAGNAHEYSLTSHIGKVRTIRPLYPYNLGVLLNFWATWCHPCLQEMPLMDQLYQTLRQQP